jgi:hypothetical protein
MTPQKEIEFECRLTEARIQTLRIFSASHFFTATAVMRTRPKLRLRTLRVLFDDVSNTLAV